MSLAKALRIFLALAVLASFACRSSNRSNHTLLIYTPHGQDMLRDFVARYRQAHPEVDVQFLDIRSREVLERLRAERNRPQADLWARADFRQPRFEKWYAQRPAPHEEEAKRFYEFVTTPESPV